MSAASPHPNDWSGPRVMAARKQMEKRLPQACGQCGRPVTVVDKWVIGHKVPRWERPDLMWDATLWQIEHRACSDKTGAKEQRRSAAAKKFSGSGPHVSLPAPVSHTHSATEAPVSAPEVRSCLKWPVSLQSETVSPDGLLGGVPEWLGEFLDVPDDAAPPLYMTPPHPEAVDSYGRAAIEWMESELKADNGKPLRLRWWQKLAIVRQLEHRADGSLCWRTVIESAPRRSGKSVRLRSIALWRIAKGAELFGEPSLVVHTGKDMGIVREIMKKSWKWASEKEGWDVRRGAGYEEVNCVDPETGLENRWLVRAQDSCYGYDISLGLVDESFAVPASVIEEAIEPAMLERESPQLLLTTTAHRKATNLMKTRIQGAISDAPDPDTLLLLWGALATDDPGAEDTWRRASPHWTEDRRRTIRARYTASRSEFASADPLEPDPKIAFENQYLNRWEFSSRRLETTDMFVTAEEWAALERRPEGAPVAAAVEAWFSEGVSLAVAYRQGDGSVVVSVRDLPTLAAAAHEATKLYGDGLALPVQFGKSLTDDPAVRAIWHEGAQGVSSGVVAELSRVVADGTFFHDGSRTLTDQVLAIRTKPRAGGIQLVSKTRLDAVKAASWAYSAARRNAGVKLFY